MGKECDGRAAAGVAWGPGACVVSCCRQPHSGRDPTTASHWQCGPSFMQVMCSLPQCTRNTYLTWNCLQAAPSHPRDVTPVSDRQGGKPRQAGHVQLLQRTTGTQRKKL